MDNPVAYSVAKNTTVMMTSQVITWTSSFILMVFLPRSLGSTEFGWLFLATSVTMMMQVVIDFGGGYVLAKEAARVPEGVPALFVNSTVLRVLLWVISMAGLLVLASLAGYTQELTLLLIILGFSKVWEGINRAMYSCFQGRELMQYPCLGGIVERVTLTVVGVAALLVGANAVVIACIMAASSFLNFFVVYQFRSRIIPSFPHINSRGMKDLFERSIPYFLWTAFSNLYYRIDAVILSVMVPASVVGWYGASYRLFDALMFLPSIFSVAIFPVLARMGEEKNGSLARTAWRSLELILLAGLPVSVLTFMFSQEIVEFLFSSALYAQSVPLLRIFAVTLLLVYIDFVLSAAIFASDRQKAWSMVALAAVFLNAGLNLFLIPFTQSYVGNGGIGSAIATTITEFFIMTSAISLLPRRIFEAGSIAVPLKGVIAAAGAALTIWMLRPLPIPWTFSAIAGLSCYVALLLLLRTAHRTELDFLKHFLSGSNLRRMFAPSREVSA